MFCTALQQCFVDMVFTDAAGSPLSSDDGFALWHDMTATVRARHGCLFLVGNGASASMSSHFAVDLHKNARIRTHVFSDAALLTAVSNDICFERVYAEPLVLSASRGGGDMLVSISSSGQSPNIIAAITTAKELGMQVVTVSGMKPDNASRCLGDLNVYVPAHTYGMVETAHAAILHHWTDLMVASAHKKA